MGDVAIGEAPLSSAYTRRDFIGMGDIDLTIVGRDDIQSYSVSGRSRAVATGMRAVAAVLGLSVNAALATPVSNVWGGEYKSDAPFTEIVDEESTLHRALYSFLDAIRMRNESAGRAAADILEVFLEGSGSDGFEPISPSALGRAIGFMFLFSDRALDFDAYEEEDGCVTVALKSSSGLIEVMFRSDATIAVYGKCHNAVPIKMVASIDGVPVPRDLIDAIDGLSQIA